MKQVVQNYRTGELKVDEVPAPTLRAGGLLVANRYSLISAGTERSTIDVAKKTLIGKAMERPDLVRKVMGKVQKDGLVETMRMVFARLDTPAALGYSCAGTVLEVGSQTEGFSVGDGVACTGQNYAFHAEVVYVPKNLSVKIPAGLDFEDASYVTAGAIALQGVRQAEPRLGETVAVIGLGLLGQLTVQMLKANGCRVIASDIVPARLERARQFGAEEAVSSNNMIEVAAAMTDGHGVDAVIIAASTKDNRPVEVAGEISRKKGRVVVLGAVGMNLPREPYYLKELELRLSTSYGPGRYDAEYEEKGHDYPYGYVRWTEKRNMEAFLSLIQQGKVNVKALTTHRYPIQDAERAYKLMMEDSEPYLGILLSYPGDQGEPRRRIEVVQGKKLDQLNIGLIGAGNHVKDMLLPNLRVIKGVQLRAVCTGGGINAKALTEKIGAAYCTSDYREVLKDKDIDAVIIGTRHHLHACMVVDALKSGKHVFVEKPLCLTLEELDEIASTYADQAARGLRLMVGFNRRYSPHGRRAQAFFEDHRDPLVMVFRVNAGAIPSDHWIQDPDVGGGRIIGEACHFLDYMQFVCGAPPISVQAKRIGTHSSGITDDQSIFSFTFADGSVGAIIYVAGGDTALGKERFEAFGDGKSLVMDDFLVSEFYHQGKKSRFARRKPDKGFQEEMAQFAGSVMEGTPSLMSFEEIQSVTRACILAMKGLQTGETYSV